MFRDSVGYNLAIDRESGKVSLLVRLSKNILTEKDVDDLKNVCSDSGFADIEEKSRADNSATLLVTKDGKWISYVEALSLMEEISKKLAVSISL